MSTSTHPIIILPDSDVEDAFFFTNTPDYTSASPDYSPASPGNTASNFETESDPSEHPFEDHSAPLAILLFHDEPYMKKRARFLSFSSIDSSAPPQVFKTGESSHVTRLKHHEEQIDAILDHLDKLPLERTKHMEDKIEGLGCYRLALEPRVMSTSTHPIIILPDSDVEDAFFFTNTPDYTSASPDYSPASPGNTTSNFETESDPSEHPFEDHSAPLAILLFHDEPYMKKRARFLSSSSIDSSALPQVFKTGESSHVTRLKHHEEQIDAIPDHLDKLPLERTEHMKDKIEGLDSYFMLSYKCYRMAPRRTSTSTAPSMNQAAIRKLVVDSVIVTLEAQAATMENTDNTNRNTEQRETLIARKCSYKEFMSCQPFNFKDCKMKFATGTLTEEALSWWNSFTQPIGIEEAYKITWRLPRSIEGNVTASKPQTLEEAITITQRLMDQVTKHNSVQGTNDHKQKFDDRRTFNNNSTNSRIEGKKPSGLMLS
nr:hypothetical protein [Tanacetum cinerariifolium]